MMQQKTHWAVEQYSGYVRSIAKRIKAKLPPQIDMEDLVNYGMLGLLEAANRYKPETGANFSTFSYYRIHGAIYDGLRNMGHVNRTEYQKIRFHEKATQYLEQNTQTSHSKAQNENITQLAEQVSQLVTIYITSLDAMKNQDMPDESHISQEQLLHQKQNKGLLSKALSALNESDRNLIDLYYFKDLSLEEVGKKLGLSKSWTCRRHAQVIGRLTALMDGLEAPHTESFSTI